MNGAEMQKTNLNNDDNQTYEFNRTKLQTGAANKKLIGSYCKLHHKHVLLLILNPNTLSTTGNYICLSDVPPHSQVCIFFCCCFLFIKENSFFFKLFFNFLGFCSIFFF